MVGALTKQRKLQSQVHARQHMACTGCRPTGGYCLATRRRLDTLCRVRRASNCDEVRGGIRAALAHKLCLRHLRDARRVYMRWEHVLCVHPMNWAPPYPATSHTLACWT